MKKNRVYSLRSFITWQSYMVLYEWEDGFSQEFGCRIEPVSLMRRLASKVLNNSRQGCFEQAAFRQSISKGYSLAIVMNPGELRYYRSQGQINFIPIFIDVFMDNVDYILNNMNNRQNLIVVTSMEIYDFLLEKGYQGRMLYAPMSISDKRVPNKVPEKDIDVLQIGRANVFLHQCMLNLVKKRPELEYVYIDHTNKDFRCVSTKRGDIGNSITRDDYLTLLSRAKISFVSSPAMDGSRDTGNINPVTARYYESIAMYCHVVGRFVENKDYFDRQLNKTSHNIKDMDQFESVILTCLNKPNRELVDQYAPFLSAYLTSYVARDLKNRIDIMIGET